MANFIDKTKKYLVNNLVALDQAVNTFLGGDPDETLSSRIGKNYKGSIFHKFVNTLFFWQKDHCEESIDPTEGKDAIFKSKEK